MMRRIWEIWPKPKKQESDDTFMVVRPSRFSFRATNNTCELLDQAFERYKKIIERHRWYPSKRHHTPKVYYILSEYNFRHDPLFVGQLETLSVNLRAECETEPHLQMNEAYYLMINSTSSVLEAYSVWGIIRGLESFSQLLTTIGEGLALRVNVTVIADEPRFSHRGLLVDTSRHFLSVKTLFKILDGMAYNKLNVFHWHIVDDHSFPYASILYPELAIKGAFHPEYMVYSQEDVKNVIEYARQRGIRVMPEFDTPGHTRSWGVSHPELLTACEGRYAGELGPMDPTKEEVYTFLSELFSEVVRIFPDKYFHLGGDEVGFECWASNRNISAFMQANNLTTYEELEEKFIQRVVDIIDDLGSNSIVWQEVFENGVRLPKQTVVQIWTGDRARLLNKVTQQGYPALLSTCWYLDHLSTGGDWRKFYSCEPLDFSGTDEQKRLVLGGTTCMWAEVVDDSNILQRIFPRASAAAEKLWSQRSVRDPDEAARRLEEHYCRLKKRGIPAQPPNGPGFCL